MRGMRFLLLFAVSLGWIGTANAESQNMLSWEVFDHEAEVPLFSNIGSLHKPITTTSPEAQKYFDQGLTLVYAFNHPEAVRAFKEAARLDPKCAMCYWGVALALGPNINAPMADANVPIAYNAVQTALSSAGDATEKERAYIEALATRYSEQVVSDRSKLDAAYADAMRKLAVKYQDDDDALTLFSEAVMDTTPWSYWTEPTEPKPEVKEVLAALKSVLARTPRHIGATHYYIHAVEASAFPQRALKAANDLSTAAPGAGHLMHMPAHIYLRLGMYDKATEANQKAVQADQEYFEISKRYGFDPVDYRAHYYSHNLHFLAYAASMEGLSKVSLDAAQRASAEITSHTLHMDPQFNLTKSADVLSLVRFGKWDDVLRLAMPEGDSLYPKAIMHYARGYAYVRLGKLEDAKRELDALKEIDGDQGTEALEQPFFYGNSLIHIARLVLEGTFDSAERRYDAAIKDLKEAVATQDKLPYMEPPYWYFPIRQALGRVYLEAGKAKDAEKTYQADLLRNPHNGWSLFGLAKAYRAQGEVEKAKRMDALFEKAWQRADVALQDSVF